MTYNEKKSLYESIMTKIAKTVKRQLNEMTSLNEAFKCDYLQKLIDTAKKFSKQNPDKDYYLELVLNRYDNDDDRYKRYLCCFKNGIMTNGKFNHPIPFNIFDDNSFCDWDADGISHYEINSNVTKKQIRILNDQRFPYFILYTNDKNRKTGEIEKNFILYQRLNPLIRSFEFNDLENLRYKRERSQDYDFQKDKEDTRRKIRNNIYTKKLLKQNNVSSMEELRHKNRIKEMVEAISYDIVDYICYENHIDEEEINFEKIKNSFENFLNSLVEEYKK